MSQRSGKSSSGETLQEKQYLDPTKGRYIVCIYGTLCVKDETRVTFSSRKGYIRIEEYQVEIEHLVEKYVSGP